MVIRSQMYVRISQKVMDSNAISNFLIARHIQSNHVERMMSRTRDTVEWILERCTGHHLYDVELNTLPKIIDTNFDMHDVVLSNDIIEDYAEDIEMRRYAGLDFSNYVFASQPDSDGKVFIDVKDNGVIKYAFTDGGLEHIMNARQYIRYDCGNNMKKEEVEKIGTACEENIKCIQDNCTLMTRAELQNFLDCEYTNTPAARKLFEGRDASRAECICFFAFYVQYLEERRLLPLPGKTSFEDIARLGAQFADVIMSNAEKCDGHAVLNFCAKLRVAKGLKNYEE